MVTILNLGGTIDLDYRGNVAAQGAVRRMVTRQAEVIDLEPVQGNNLTWRHLRALRTELVNPNRMADRFLITVGTDVLEEVVYFISLVRRPHTSVAVVGSFAPPADANAAGWSVSIAMRWLEQDRDEGLVTCTNGEIVSGALVEKVFVEGWRFRSREASDDQLRGWRLDPDAMLTSIAPRVPLLTMCVDCVGWSREALLVSRPDGLVLCGFGSGDVPARMVRSLRALVAQGIPVVLASRSHPGIVQEAFPGIAGASHQLLHKGFLGGGALDGVLARVRLLVALGARPRVPLADVFRNQSQGVGTELGGY